MKPKEPCPVMFTDDELHLILYALYVCPVGNGAPSMQDIQASAIAKIETKFEKNNK